MYSKLIKSEHTLVYCFVPRRSLLNSCSHEVVAISKFTCRPLARLPPLGPNKPAGKGGIPLEPVRRSWAIIPNIPCRSAGDIMRSRTATSVDGDLIISLELPEKIL